MGLQRAIMHVATLVDLLCDLRCVCRDGTFNLECQIKLFNKHPSFFNKIPTPYLQLSFPTHPTVLSFHIDADDDVLSHAGAVPDEPGNFLVFFFWPLLQPVHT